MQHNLARSAIGHNHPPEVGLDEIVAAFSDILTQPRSSDLPSHIDTAFDKAQIYRGLERTLPDPLLVDLFGFHDGDLPRMNNLFCADLGVLNEKLVKQLFEMSCLLDVDTRTATMRAARAEYEALCQARKHLDLPKWKDADFFLGPDTIIEVKYRFNSYQSKADQIAAARAYRALGYKPVFLHLSSEFLHRDDFEAAGWEVHAGLDAIGFINLHCGSDFEQILQRVAAQPVIRSRIEAARDRMMERMKKEAESDFLHGLPEIQNHVLSLLANDATLLERFASDHLARQDDPALTPDAISARAEYLADAAFCEIGTEKIDSAFDALDLNDKKTFLVRAFSDLEEEDRLDILSRS